MKRHSTGALGERLAQDFLKRKGFRILETNYRCREGEIDIVARQKDCLVFVEVRTKSNLQFGSPEESISAAKMKHLKQTAMCYCQDHDGLRGSWRIDLVAVEFDSNNKLRRIELIENAVEE
jgi:putative endonuclease